MHRKCYRYDVTLKTDSSTIWSDNVQLAFLIALEDLSEVDIATHEYSIECAIRKFELSGYTNLKTLNSADSITIVGTFDGCRIVVKYTYEDISEKIVALRKHASNEAKRTGIYRGIDPRYAVNKPDNNKTDIDDDIDFDLMDGYEFECFCARLLSKNGYKDVSVTKSSGDQGIDILARRLGKNYGIQCKCYSSDIGNKAVMEAYAGVSYYRCDVGVVLSNRYYTKAAKDMAQRTGILLWDRDDLLKLIKNGAKN